jgi:hypothetical protein
MGIAFLIALAAGFIGWRRAAKRGGVRADKIQYALAHGIPAFLITLIALVLATNMGWIA